MIYSLSKKTLSISQQRAGNHLVYIKYMYVLFIIYTGNSTYKYVYVHMDETLIR
jgi:hypothetical protein